MNLSQTHTDQSWNVTAAFDALASRYDKTWTNSLLGSIQRAAVWRKMDRIFRPGERILDLGCGTGADAAHMARAGVRVHATDISVEMLQTTRRRIESEGLSDLVTYELRALEDLPDLKDRGPFDGAISNFGVLNCVEDLRPLASGLAGLLRPGGRLLLCSMGRFCIWETIWYLMHAQPRKAFRRWSNRGVPAVFGSGPHFQVFYPSVVTITAAFKNNFRMASFHGIGVLVPPSYLEHLALAAREFFLRLGTLDQLLGSWPILRSVGDHRLFVFVRN